jgi:hypothetical protein
LSDEGSEEAKGRALAGPVGRLRRDVWCDRGPVARGSNAAIIVLAKGEFVIDLACVPGLAERTA